MSRSRRKTPCISRASNASDKHDKRLANRRLRSMVRRGEYDLTLRDVSDPWSFSKDGKRYKKDLKEEYYRK